MIQHAVVTAARSSEEKVDLLNTLCMHAPKIELYKLLCTSQYSMGYFIAEANSQLVIGHSV